MSSNISNTCIVVNNLSHFFSLSLKREKFLSLSPSTPARSLPPFPPSLSPSSLLLSCQCVEQFKVYTRISDVMRTCILGHQLCTAQLCNLTHFLSRRSQSMRISHSCYIIWYLYACPTSICAFHNLYTTVPGLLYRGEKKHEFQVQEISSHNEKQRLQSSCT